MTAFSGRAAPLTDAGVAAAAQSIGTTSRLLRTVMAVETAGHGFRNGKLAMLFEPGTFYHRVPAPKRDAACRAGCALASMAGHHYPNDSYPLLDAAMKIDSTAALESASWGLPQVMGFNHGMAGYVSAEAMIADFVDSEDAQVMALAKFLKASRLVDALNAHHWAVVAQGYNGLGYAKNAYDTKLAAAYAAIKEATVVAVATAVPARVPLHVDPDKPVLAGIETAINTAAASGMGAKIGPDGLTDAQRSEKVRTVATAATAAIKEGQAARSIDPDKEKAATKLAEDMGLAPTPREKFGWAFRTPASVPPALQPAAPVHIDNQPGPPPAGLGARLRFLFTGKAA